MLSEARVGPLADGRIVGLAKNAARAISGHLTRIIRIIDDVDVGAARLRLARQNARIDSKPNALRGYYRRRGCTRGPAGDATMRSITSARRSSK